MLVAPVAGAFDNTDEIAQVFDILQASQNDAVKKAELLRQGLERIELGLKQTASDPLKQAGWLYNLWFYHFLKEDYGECIIALEKALVHLSDSSNGVEQTLKTLTELSYSLILTGRIAESKNYLRRALVLATESKSRAAISSAYYGLGDAYRKTGEMSVAQRYFEAALDLERGAANQDRFNNSSIKLGSLARYKGNYTDAIEKHRSALEYYSDKSPYRKVVAEIELARDYLGVGEIEKSKYYARAAASNPIVLTEQKLDAEIQLLKAINAQQAKNPLSDEELDEARRLIKTIERSLKRSIDTHVTNFSRPTRQIQFAEVAMRYFSQNENPAEVFRIGDNVVLLIKKIAVELRRNNADYLAWMALVQPVLNEYISNLYLHEPGKVFEVLESIYTIGLSSPMPDNPDFLGQSFEAREIKLFDAYLQAESALVDAATSNERQPGTAMVGVAMQQLETQRDLAREAYLHIKDPALDQHPALVPGNVNAIKIPEDELYLRYFVQEEVSFVVVLGQGAPEFYSLPPRSAVREMIDAAHADIAGRGHGYSESLARLQALLPLEVIKNNKAVKKLVIVPDDAIYSVPFSAINLASDATEYLPLVSKYQVVRTTSMGGYYSDQVSSRIDPEVKAPDILIFADPVFNTKNPKTHQTHSEAVSQWAQGLERLPYTRSEAEEIQQIFPSQSVSTFKGEQATAAILMSDEARSAKILHIATHGYFNTATPDIVGIATSPHQGSNRNHNGFLSLSKLLSEPFFGHLVIISGCETMRGKHYNGQGVRSMSRGFLSQGAGSVVGALWEVSDRATAKFMANFYRNLKRNGGNSALALQSAKNELSRMKRYSAPKYWAGFVLESSNHQFDQKVFNL